MDKYPVSCVHLDQYFHLEDKLLQQQYREHISDYRSWEQREHASEWMVFADNTGARLSIDETALSNGELYTIVTNKAAKGRKKALVAIRLQVLNHSELFPDQCKHITPISSTFSITAAESFNAKIKAFRVTSRRVRDINFFLFRVANIYA